MKTHPCAVLPPGAEGLIGRRPLRQIVRHSAPGPAAAPHGLEAMAHLPQRLLAGATAELRWRQQDVRSGHSAAVQSVVYGKRWRDLGVAPAPHRVDHRPHGFTAYYTPF